MVTANTHTHKKTVPFPWFCSNLCNLSKIPRDLNIIICLGDEFGHQLSDNTRYGFQFSTDLECQMLERKVILLGVLQQ